MAKFLLGGIVTNVAGSVGGTTLRRVSNGFSMYNKIKGTSRAKLLSGSRVSQIGVIFQRWSQLGDTLRSAWNSTATTVTFPDKFGTPKYLTGRQLFSKSNIQLLPISLSLDDPAGFTKNTTPFTLDAVQITGIGGISYATISVPTGEARVLVSMELKNSNIYQPTYISRKVIAWEDISGTGFDMALEAAIAESFPYITAGMSVAVYCQAINEWGQLSPYQCLISTVL